MYADRLHYFSVIFLSLLHESALINSASSDLHVSTVHVTNLHTHQTCSNALFHRTSVMYALGYYGTSLLLLPVVPWTLTLARFLVSQLTAL
jgi:hypothetical protein